MTANSMGSPTRNIFREWKSMYCDSVPKMMYASNAKQAKNQRIVGVLKEALEMLLQESPCLLYL